MLGVPFLLKTRRMLDGMDLVCHIITVSYFWCACCTSHYVWLIIRRGVISLEALLYPNDYLPATLTPFYTIPVPLKYQIFNVGLSGSVNMLRDILRRDGFSGYRIIIYHLLLLYRFFSSSVTRRLGLTASHVLPLPDCV